MQVKEFSTNNQPDMKKITWNVLMVVLIIPVFAVCQPKEVDTVFLYYLGGQSNMDGHGYTSGLPEKLNKTFSEVPMYHGNPAIETDGNGGLGIWDALKPGHGVGFSSDGNKNNLSERFGVELSFAQRLQALHPKRDIALIKYSRGGSSIDSTGALNSGCWDPNYQGKNRINHYRYFLKTLRHAFDVKDIDGDGREEYLIPKGIIWMQGESDAARSEAVAMRYHSNLTSLMDLIRAAFLDHTLPVVIGKISDSWDDADGKVMNWCDLVQYGQEKYVKTDHNATIIRDTRYYGYVDKWHYDNKGYIDLGEKFAEAVYRLNK